MDANQIMELLERRNDMEEKWYKKRSELLKCEKCTSVANMKLKNLQQRRNANDAMFQKSLESPDTTIIFDPSNANRKIDEEIANVRNGYGFAACSEEHEKLIFEIAMKAKSISSINEILSRVK